MTDSTAAAVPGRALPAASFAGSFARLDRAREHFESLRLETQAYTAAVNGQAALVRVGRSLDFDLSVHFDLEPPVRLSLILGDALNNLRSSLDYAIFSTASATSAPSSRAQGFPIITNEGDWAKTVRGRLGELPPACIDYLHALQPFQHSQIGDRLAGLAAFNNHDKHHSLHVTTLAAVLWNEKTVRIGVRGRQTQVAVKVMDSRSADQRLVPHEDNWIARLRLEAPRGVEPNKIVRALMRGASPDLRLVQFACGLTTASRFAVERSLDIGDPEELCNVVEQVLRRWPLA